MPADVLELPSLSVNKPSPIGRAVLATAGVALALIPLAVIIGTRHKIVVFAIALLFAYVLLPAVSWVEARLPARWPRSLALAIIYWALNSELVHALEHACFFGTSLMFWSLVLEPTPHRRMGYGSALLFVTAFSMQNGLLGAILTFSGHPLYSSYRSTTASWGLTPLEDQQIAGLLMWIPGSIIHLATLGFLFVEWLRAAAGQAITDAVPL